MAGLNLSQIPPPEVIENVNFDRILQLIRADFFQRDPDYIQIEQGDPGHSNMETMAYIIDIVLERVNAAVAACIVTHATGADLDNLAALFSLRRNTNETDDDFRVRVTNHLEAIVAGSIVWYKQYVNNLSVVEVTGAENVVDGTPTPVLSTVKDSHVILRPNPSYNASQPRSAANLPEIPGSINIYIQSSQWTDPRSGIITQVIPSPRMLQTVRNYINAEGQNETDTQRLQEAQERRFLCDTVYILPAETQPYVFCAMIRVVPGLDPYDVLQRVSDAARKFVLENERVGQRIPFSDFYRVINTDEVTEVILEYPTSDITPADNAVPVVFAEHKLSVQRYETIITPTIFGRTPGSGWSVNAGKLIFRVVTGSQDHQFLEYLRTANRITVTAFNAEGEVMPQPLRTYRVSGQVSYQPTAGGGYYELGLVGTPDLTGFTNNTNYELKILDSIEVQLAGEL